MPYGSPSRRASSTIRRSGSSPIRQRYEPSDTVIGSVGVPICACTARGAARSAIRASCLSAADRRRLDRPDRHAARSDSSTVACSTSTSPSAGSTAAMYDRNARFGPTISTPDRRSRSRCR